MTEVESELIRLLLVNLPPGAAAHEVAHALPLGSRAAVSARLAELLPGSSFDEDGRGSFHRGHYHIDFTMADEEPTRIEVSVDRAEALVALQRIVAKTGWRAVDPFRGGFVDLDASAAAGAVVTSGQAAIATEVMEDESPPWRRWLGRTVLMLVVVGTTWLGWMWSQRAPSLPIPKPGTEQPELVARAIGGGASPENVEAAREAIARQAAQVRARIARVKTLTPEFRDDPVVHQLLDYLQATIVFRTEFATSLYMPPDQLASGELLGQFHHQAYLPPAFAEPERSGYRYEFTGSCGRPAEYVSALDDLCESFSYIARPIDPSRSGPRTYALLSSDLRVHYRQDGTQPTERDPTVDNLTPSTAADLPGGVPEPERGGVMGWLSRVAQWVTNLAFGPGGTKQATAELHESNALGDLRATGAAEQQFNVTMGLAEFYASPDQLADAGNFTQYGLQPFLPAYFMQSQRQGYVYEFLGTAETPPRALLTLGRVYRDFIYVARPIEPGPAGRRTFALYPDGVIFATSDGRVPTRADTPIGR